ncbi:MAG: DUF86 domain-containing protein [Nanoarchaeota archaeon]
MKERLSRYNQKFNFICEKLEKIPAKPSGLVIDATLYAVQVSIDAAMDIVAMLVKDLGEEVSDDYHNLGILQEKKILSQKEADILKRYNGLRNAIVHKYNKFEEKEVTEHIGEIKNNLYAFLEKVENAVKKIFAGNKEGFGKLQGI